MAVRELLHSGEFTTQDDGKVVVEFYKVYNLNVYPRVLEFGTGGGTLQVTIWSTKGSARLTDPVGALWLNYNLDHSELLPGSVYYRYTYNIICDANATGQDRSYNWTVNIEDGEGTGVATTTFRVKQDGGSAGNLSVVPYSITYLPWGGTYGITAYFTGTEPTATLTYVQGDPGWLTQLGSGYVDGDRKEWAWTASANNTGSSRTAKVTVTNGTDTVIVGISQASGEPILSVLPSSMDFSPLGQRKDAVVTNISGVLTNTKPSWITISESGSGGSRLLGVTAASNLTGSSRRGTVVLNDGRNNPVSIAVEQIEMQTLNVSPNSVSYSYGIGTSNFVVNYPSSYSVTTSVDYQGGPSGWIDGIELVSTSGSNRTYSIDVAPNPSTSPREAVVTFNGSMGGADDVTLAQDGAPDPFTVNPSSINIGINGTTTVPGYVTFSGGGSASVSFDSTHSDSWVSGYTYGVNGHISATVNDSVIERNGRASFVNSSGDYVYVSVKQAGTDLIFVPDPVIINASGTDTNLPTDGLTILCPLSSNGDVYTSGTVPSWLHLSWASWSSANLRYYLVSADANDTGTTRTATVTFQAKINGDIKGTGTLQFIQLG